MSRHTINAMDWGSHSTMGDWEAEYVITFEYRPGRPAVRYLRNGDPGYPAEPPEIEFVSISPDAGHHGAFSDIAQKHLEEWAEDWLAEHEDECIEKAEDDLQARDDKLEER